MRSRRASAAALALAALAMLAGAPHVSAAVEPFDAPPDRAALAEEEQRVWSAGDDLDRSFRRARNLYRDESLAAYLQAIVDALYPEFRGTIVLKGIVRDADPNAFVLPNGSVYLTLGLVGRMDSEAQLAMVLGHESAHFVHRHGYQQMSSAKSISAFGLGLTVLAGGVGAIGNVALVGVFYGYSRDSEREADRVGFERAMHAGYPPQAGIEAFEILAADAKLYDRKQPTFFASHPSTTERIENFRELIGALPAAPAAAAAATTGPSPGSPAGAPATADAGTARVARYREATAKARLDYLRLAVETGRQKSVVAMLEPRFSAGDVDAATAFWLAEAYRLRGEEADPDRALAAYRWSLERAPGMAAAWRGIGELARRAGRHDEAIDAWRRYLEGAPDAVDRQAVRAELERLQASREQGDKQ